MNVEAVVSRLKSKLCKYFSSWVGGVAQRKICFNGPSKVFCDYVEGEDNSELLGARADKLCTWYLNNYSNTLLNKSSLSAEDVTLCARYARATVHFEEAFANAEQGGSVLLYVGALYLSLNIIVGWKADADAVGAALYRGLDTSLLDLRHTDQHEKGTLYRHFWFLMHLYCDAKGLALDTSKYSYPEDMNPYAEVLADWRTPDLAKVQAFVSAMADFHVQEARTTAHDEIAEFDTEDRMLFPYEILAFLRLREWLGLANPEVFEHPLMQQPLAKLPEDVPLAVPETPLLDQVVVKFQQEYPGSFA